MAGVEANFKRSTVQAVLQMNFKDDKTKVNSQALLLTREVLKIFVSEAASRSAIQAKKESFTEVTIDEFEKILPQLMLDM